MLRSVFHSLAALALIAGGHAAASANDDMCRKGLFTHQDNLAQARVSEKRRTFFYEDTDGCPTRAGALDECRTDSYVIEGDTLVVGRSLGDFVCALFPKGGGGTAGWIRRNRVTILPNEASPPLSAWEGDWTDHASADVTILSKDGRTYIVGQAFWPARPEENTWPTIHIGEVNDRLAIAGHRAIYSDDNLCELDLTLLRDFLLIADNHKCGGANVTFSGVYTRPQ